MARALISLSLVLGVLAGCGERAAPYYQGYAEAEYVRVALPFGGMLEKLHVERGAQVKEGDVLFALENENETAMRREAEERLRNAEAQLANLKKSRRPPEIASVRAQLAQAQAALELSEAQLKRTGQLVKQNFISKERYDETQAARDRDRARVEQLKADVDTARLAVARPEEIRAGEAAVAAARATLDQAAWRLGQKSAIAPVSGLIADTYFVKGEWVNAGAPVVNLLPPQNRKVRFFVPEAVLGTLRVGQEFHVMCDGCGDPIPVHVSFIAPQAEFTPPVIYSKENRAKLVFLIEARPAPEHAARLHPGQPVEVRAAR